jgi:hypothetical protein
LVTRRLHQKTINLTGEKRKDLLVDLTQTKTINGAWFDINYPSNFTAKGSLIQEHLIG